MTTENQINANRKNALKSTVPQQVVVAGEGHPIYTCTNEPNLDEKEISQGEETAWAKAHPTDTCTNEANSHITETA